MKKYVVCPGYITSKIDKQRHFISASKLIGLYGVDPSDCFIANEWGEIEGVKPDDMIWLYPSYHGNYKIPTIKGNKK